MKNLMGNAIAEMNFVSFGFDVLSENEMMKVRGGEDIRPTSREKDEYDIES